MGRPLAKLTSGTYHERNFIPSEPHEAIAIERTSLEKGWSMAREGSSGSRIKPAYTRQQRVAMAKQGLAIPITNDAGAILDGSCPIANRDDLALAIKSLWGASTRSPAA